MSRGLRRRSCRQRLTVSERHQGQQSLRFGCRKLLMSSEFSDQRHQEYSILGCAQELDVLDDCAIQQFSVLGNHRTMNPQGLLSLTAVKTQRVLKGAVSVGSRHDAGSCKPRPSISCLIATSRRALHLPFASFMRKG